MSRRFWRQEGMWSAGWIWGTFWFTLSWRRRHSIYLDIGHWRLRWAGPDHHPLFSERYGYQKWHKLGRLAANRNKHEGLGT